MASPERVPSPEPLEETELSGEVEPISSPESVSDQVDPERRRKEELKEASTEVQRLLKEDTFESAAAAVQRLMTLKREGATLAARHQPTVFEQLRKHYGDASHNDEADQERVAEYYQDLVELGVVEEPTETKEQPMEDVQSAPEPSLVSEEQIGPEAPAIAKISAEDAVWAHDALQQIRAGRKTSEVVNEEYLSGLLRAQVYFQDLGREQRRLRYLARWEDELDFGQALREGGALNAVTLKPFSRVLTGWGVAEGWQKLKALSPRWKDRQAIWRDVIAARADAALSMKETAEDRSLPGRTRALLGELAAEFDDINQRDRLELEHKEWNFRDRLRAYVQERRQLKAEKWETSGRQAAVERVLHLDRKGRWKKVAAWRKRKKKA